MNHFIRTFVVILAATELYGCASTIPKDYSGPDAGYLIVALGASPDTEYSSYTLLYRTRGESARGSVLYLQNNLFKPTARDFDDSSENGFVDVQKLRPGEYELYNFSIYLNRGKYQNYYKSRENFSIPFSIKPGVAFYLGDFEAHKITGRNLLGLTIPGGAYFVLTDKQQRDIPIAKAKAPFINNLEIGVPSVEAVSNPLIRAAAD